MLATLIVGMAAIWGALALWYQVPGGHALQTLGVTLWALLSSAMLVALWQGRTALGLLGFAAAFTVLLFWWQLLRPSNDHIWAADVAQMMTGTLDGNRVTLHNVRNFDWRSDSDYTQRWETRHFGLDRLNSVDMIMSYWSGPAIAHMLVSFGFDDADYVVFSVEIRPEQGESFSEIGGFFNEFELSIVAADERDVIRVRTNVRGEDDYLYHINMPISAAGSRLTPRRDHLGFFPAILGSDTFSNGIRELVTAVSEKALQRVELDHAALVLETFGLMLMSGLLSADHHRLCESLLDLLRGIGDDQGEVRIYRV